MSDKVTTAVVGCVDPDGKLKNLELVRDDYQRAEDLFRNLSLEYFQHEPTATELGAGKVRLENTTIFILFYDYEPFVETVVEFLQSEFQ